MRNSDLNIKMKRFFDGKPEPKQSKEESFLLPPNIQKFIDELANNTQNRVWEESLDVLDSNTGRGLTVPYIYPSNLVYLPNGTYHHDDKMSGLDFMMEKILSNKIVFPRQSNKPIDMVNYITKLQTFNEVNTNRTAYSFPLLFTSLSKFMDCYLIVDDDLSLRVLSSMNYKFDEYQIILFKFPEDHHTNIKPYTKRERR